MITALVPMKGHSERVPNKNLRHCAGNPLCTYIINTLAAVDEITEILVNTDSEEIASVCESMDKVKIINRPEELRGDFVSMNKVIEYDLSQAQNDIVLQTHSTNPLLTVATIEKGISTFQSTDVDSVFSVTRYQSRFYDDQMKAVNHNPEQLIRTQDLPPLFEENSNFYLFTKESFAASGGKRIGINPGLVEMEALEATDIDEEQDFILAEVLIGMRWPF